jgi:predicted ATPase/DNA-binding SARP family transcriptional activator
MQSSGLRIRLLGMFEVVTPGGTVARSSWRSHRAAAAIKLTALAPGFRLHREVLADALWPELGPNEQANNLNVALSRARRALVEAGAQGGRFLRREGALVALGDPPDLWVDAAEFRAAAAGASGDLERIDAALTLYAGDLLPDDRYEPWAEEARAGLRRLAQRLRVDAASALAQRGDRAGAIIHLERALEEEPADEAAGRRLIELYAQTGQERDAVACFRRLDRALREELGVGPEPATVDAVNRLKPRPAKAPPPAAMDSLQIHTPLPVPIDRTIGREQELARLLALVGQERLVTVSGAGGIGKTRLALLVAHAAAHRFEESVGFVDLAALTRAAQVLPAVAQAIGGLEAGGSSTVASLAAAIGSRRGLLVLDNFEHVVEAGATVAELVMRAPKLSVLVTSRVPLRVRGEIEFVVPPLAFPAEDDGNDPASVWDSPAVRLFLERARRVRPDFAATDESATSVAEICRRLDGLPLALELAAARARVLSPEAMLRRLEDPLALLVEGDRDLPPRQRTMRATIEWSYGLLSAPEQRLLQRLTVFAGGWTLEAAEEVVGTTDLGISVVDGLASLVEKNLLRRESDALGRDRFLLLETIRELAAEKLSGQAAGDVARDRHAAWAVRLAEEARSHLESHGMGEWLEQLAAEDANLRAAEGWLRRRQSAEPALRLATALSIYRFIRGLIREGCDAQLIAADLPGSERFPALKIAALVGAGMLAREIGEYDLAWSASERARALAASVGDDQRQADAQANQGYVALQRGETGLAHRLFAAALEAYRAGGNEQGVADAISFQALAHHVEGNFAESERLNRESQRIWQQLGDRQAEVWSHARLGDLFVSAGKLGAAAVEYRAGLRLADEIKFQWGLSWCVDGFAHLAYARGEVALAAACLDTAEGLRTAKSLTLSAVDRIAAERLREKLAAERPPRQQADRNLDDLIETLLGSDLGDAHPPHPPAGSPAGAGNQSR